MTLPLKELETQAGTVFKCNMRQYYDNFHKAKVSIDI